MNWRERIERDPRTLQGKPHIRGTGIPVSVVLDDLAARLDFRDVLASHPALSEEDVRAVISWAAEVSHEQDAGVSTEAPTPTGGTPPQRSTDGAHDFWSYLMSMPPGCDDADFERPVDYGRPEVDFG